MALNMKTLQGKQCRKTFGGVRCQSRRPAVVRAQAESASVPVARRDFLQAAVLATASLAVSPLSANAAKAPSGFTLLEDLNDAYKFVYPFGWQEVSVKGADVVFKDVIESLESVSVVISASDKKDVTEFGDVEPVCETLAKEVLTAPGTTVKIVATTKRADEKGHNYYEVEFTADNGKYVRHQLAVIAAAEGKFYTLTTGSSERRWGKMKEKLNTTIHSFTVL